MGKNYTYTYERVCEVCKKNFTTHRPSTKLCSKACISLKISQSRVKYTKQQQDQALALRSQGLSIPEISKQLHIGIPFLKKLIQKNKAYLTPEQKKKLIPSRWHNHEPIINNTKKCTKCKAILDIIYFSKSKSRAGGLHGSCKQCVSDSYHKNSNHIKKNNKEYRENNPEKIKETFRNYYEKNRDTYIERAKSWSITNPDKRREIARKYRIANQFAKNARTAHYRAMKINATPKWLSERHRTEMRDIYKKCPKGHHVDHIVPLRSEIVCGLHVPWNLQILKAEDNMSKGNTVPIKDTPLTICHQKIRRDQTLEEDFKNGAPKNAEITDFTFAHEKMASEHKKFIERYEWLGTVGRGTKWTFTARYKNGLLGGVVLISEPNAYMKGFGKERESLIHRGACASWTPKNLGSKLVMFSCRWMVQNTTKRLFSAYSDPEAGEIGTIYQACNFDYLGSGWGSKTRLILPWGKETTPQYFNQTATYKKACKELGITWLPNWSKPNGFKNLKEIPIDVKARIKEWSKSIIEQSLIRNCAPKGKYVLLLGKNKTEQKYLNKLKNWQTQNYPKRIKESS
jgi:hypothetical protein